MTTRDPVQAYKDAVEARELGSADNLLAALGRVLLVAVAYLAFLGLGVLMTIAGLLSLLGFGPGSVAKLGRLTPAGRAVELAVGGK